MPTIHNLHHINIETCMLEETRRFLEEVLGMTAGPRPSIPANGYWMYLNDHAIVHLIEIPENGGLPAERVNRIDHFAVAAKGKEEIRAILERRGDPYREGNVLEDHTLRFFVKDPNGITIEIAFLVDKETRAEVENPPADWYVGTHLYEPVAG